jgi:hypothetical protein
MSTYPLAKGEQAMLQAEPGEPIDTEMVAYTTDGSTFRFSPGTGSIIQEGDKKVLKGQVVKKESWGKTLIPTRLPFEKIERIEMDAHIYVYTKDSLRYEFAPFAWAFEVSGGTVHYIRGTPTVEHIEFEEIKAGSKEIPIEQIERIEMERTDPGKTALISLGVVALLAGIFVLIGNSYTPNISLNLR